MTLRQRWIAFVLMVAAGRPAVLQADLYWDTNSSNAGGSASDAAPGTWGTDNFWSSDPGGLAVTGPWVADETAVFSADANVTGTYDVAVSGTQSASGIRFEEGAVSLTGGTVSLANAADINIATGLTATIGSVIGGSAGLTQSGAGTLVLTGANNYAGNTMLATNPISGTFNVLQLGASEVIPNTSVVQILGQNSIFDLNGQTETVKSFASVGAGAGAFMNSRIDIGSGTLIVADDPGQTETYQAPLFASSSGRIVKTGAGQLNLTASNSGWDGEFVLSGGLLGFGVSNALGTSSSGTAKLTLDGGTITFFNAGSRSIQTQNVDITNSFGALIGASNIELLGLASGGEGTAITTLKVDNPTITVSNTTGTTGVFILRGPIGDEGQNRGFTKAGPGALTLNNPGNTYGGDTTILEGQLRIDNNATLGDGTGTVHLSGGALTVTVNRDPNADPIPNAINVTADSTISTTRAQVDPAVNLNFASNSIGGSAGTLTFRNDAAAGGTQTANVFEPQFSGSGFNFSRPIVIAAGLNSPTRTTRLNLGNASGTQTFSGDISGPGMLRRMTGGGNTVLAGANTYSGGTEVEGGTLTVSGPAATLGTGDVTVTGGTLSIASGVANAVANTAMLSISGTGIVNLGTGINETIGSLSLGGVAQPSGTYGSSASSATFKLDQYFSGVGIVDVSAAGFAADFDNDGNVDGDDLTAWKAGYGTGTTKAQGDADGDVDVDGADFLVWQQQVGSGLAVPAASAVPEPAALCLVLVGMAAALAQRGRRSARPCRRDAWLHGHTSRQTHDAFGLQRK